MIEVTDLKVQYGPVIALRGISFKVEKGELVTLIGANGAGKTTTLKAIMGLVSAQGRILFSGESVISLSSTERVKRGMVLVPEGRGIFSNLTVRENLELGAYVRGRANFDQELIKVLDLFPRLKERLRQRAGSLSGGEQQMLAIGRALMSQPSFLMLDEPSMGLAPKIVADIFKLIVRLRDSGVTILLVEQNAMAALKISDRAYIIENGCIVREGPARPLIEDPEIRKSYLGIR